MLPLCLSADCKLGCLQVLATECEIEEEYLVNNLQKRIGKLHQEKTQLEQSLGVLQRKVISIAELRHTMCSSQSTLLRHLVFMKCTVGAAALQLLTFHCCSM